MARRFTAWLEEFGRFIERNGWADPWGSSTWIDVPHSPAPPGAPERTPDREVVHY